MIFLFFYFDAHTFFEQISFSDYFIGFLELLALAFKSLSLLWITTADLQIFLQIKSIFSHSKRTIILQIIPTFSRNKGTIELTCSIINVWNGPKYATE